MGDRSRLEQKLGRRLSDDDWHEVEVTYGGDMAAGAEGWLKEAAIFAQGVHRGRHSPKTSAAGRGSTTTTAFVPDDGDAVPLDARSAALTKIAHAMATDHPRVERWRAMYRPNGDPRPADSLSAEETRELAALGEYLAGRYGWDMREAQAFVAVDFVPPVRPIRATVTVSSDAQRLPDSHALGGELMALPWLNRVTLDVDPTVTPDQLADHWKDLRRRCVPGTHRPQRQRRLELVAFIADRAADESAGEVMRAWNTTHPDATYSHSHHLVRDAGEALASLLCAPLGLPDE